jgi:ribosomal protein S18 acetylase RimI-like enzyme
VLVYNIGRFGMDEGGLPLNGHYFGRRDGSGLIAAGAVYNLGSLFFFAHGEQALEGLASYLLESGLRPWFTQGPRSQVELLLSEFADAGGPVPETLVEMGQEMQSELFQTEGMDEASMADLLGLQIEIGGAFVREVDGAVVATAEATPAVPHAALVGGVYTLPEHRGRGHSTACVAALCSRMLERVGAVALSVEPENEAAFRAYRRIGFRKVTDWMVVTFTAGREAS